MKGLPVTKRLVNMILSIGSMGLILSVVVNCTGLWQCLNYYTGVSVLMMEQARVSAARTLQCLPNHSSCLAVTASLGWLSIESHIDVKRLCCVHSLI